MNAEKISMTIGNVGTRVTGEMLEEYPQLVAERAAVAVANNELEAVLDGTYVSEENGGAE